MGDDTQELRDLLTRIDERTKMLVERRDDHETRIRLIEKLVWIASGAAAIAGTFFSYVMKKVGLT